MVRWVVGSILHGGPIELFLVPASAPCVFIMLSKMELCGKSVCSWYSGSSDQSFMVDPLSYLLFQPVLHDWCNKGCGMSLAAPCC